MSTPLDPETLRAVETEMTRLMQPEEGTGRYLDGAETWNRLLTWIRLRCVPPASGAALAEAAAPRPAEAQSDPGDYRQCPTCSGWVLRSEPHSCDVGPA